MITNDEFDRTNPEIKNLFHTILETLCNPSHEHYEIFSKVFGTTPLDESRWGRVTQSMYTYRTPTYSKSKISRTYTDGDIVIKVSIRSPTRYNHWHVIVNFTDAHSLRQHVKNAWVYFVYNYKDTGTPYTSFTDFILNDVMVNPAKMMMNYWNRHEATMKALGRY